MQTPSDTAHQMLLERHAERKALEVCRSATYLKCLKDYGVAPTTTVHAPKGISITVRAIDIYALRKRLFELVNLECIEYPLSSMGEHIVDVCEQWLLHEYTGRYRLLISPVQRQWLRSVLILVVVRHIMEQKYERFTKEGGQTFVDPWVCSEMGRLTILHTLPGQLAQLVHHIQRDPEQAQRIIDEMYDKTDKRMKECLFANSDPLPPLPEGLHVPFPLLAQEKEPHHD
jgi:hypothetical protein